MKKIIKKTSLAFVILIILSSIICPFFSRATGESVTIYATHSFRNLLERNGININCIYMVQNFSGEENPAYCLNYEKDGATEDFSYEVTVDSQITDMGLWRTVVNGFPYKTPQELGCETKEEAYMATRHAIYCYLYDRDLESYSAIGGEAGERTLAALKSIVQTAKTSNEVKVSPNLAINCSDNLWQLDNDNMYVSKTYTVLANAPLKTYTIEISGNLIEGMKITDINNVEKNKFNSNESFKILIPLKNIDNDGNFSITVNADVYTRPVYFGRANDEGYQNIAVTGSFYEAGMGTKTEYYFKNKTAIKIIKQDQESKEKIAGVKFQILDKDKNILLSDLTTNKDGEIIVDNLIPDKYYIKEVETLENYQVYEDVIEVNLKLNEETTITVNNLKDKNVPVQEQIITELEVEQIRTVQEVKLPRTGM